MMNDRIARELVKLASGLERQAEISSADIKILDLFDAGIQKAIIGLGVSQRALKNLSRTDYGRNEAAAEIKAIARMLDDVMVEIKEAHDLSGSI